ncbi:MAG: class I tRNA ligase family protein, partial [Gemmatimonadaceae bacterium]
RPAHRERWRGDELAQGLRLSEYVETARRFVWNELADWYVEAAKARITADGAGRDVARAVLVHVFDQALRLLHPVVPFVTEALWQRLPGHASDAFLARAVWPRAGAPRSRAASFEIAREAVSAIRQIRAEYGVTPGKFVDAVLVARDDRSAAVLAEESALIGRLARATVSTDKDVPHGAAAHALLPDGSEVSVMLAGLVDLARECARVSADLAQLEKQLGALEQRLANESFVSRARPDVVEAERRKLEEWSTRREQLTSKKRTLCGA